MIRQSSKYTIHLRRTSRGSAPPLWLWILVLIAVGCFVALVLFMENYQRTVESTAKPWPNSQSSTGANSNKDSEKSTNFDFYNLLPELESIIPEKRVEPKSAQTPPETTTALEPPTAKPTPISSGTNTLIDPGLQPTGRYYLQAGAFKDFRSADSRRASLALIGVESSIQKANIPNRGLWHRVRIGPFKTMQEMKNTRKLLINKKIQSIMLTVKG